MSSEQTSTTGQPSKKDMWNVEAYTQKAAPFVPQLTRKIVSWLDPQPNDTILDIGCGDGLLMHTISQTSPQITGIDSSSNLILHLQKTYPSLTAHILDCSTSLYPLPTFLGPSSYNKIFSNAALHWILRDPSSRPQFFRGVRELLRPGGQIVAECGGFGNVGEVHAALRAGLMARGVGVEDVGRVCPWWFPTVEEMREVAEKEGLVWVKGELELRQTELTQGEGGGVKGWIKLFGAPFRDALEQGEKGEQAWEQVVDMAAQALEGVCKRGDGKWMVNYIRLRFVAKKPE